jgi:hypothetical protein
VSRDILADADSLCDKATVLRDTIKGTLRVKVLDINVSDFSVAPVLTSSCVRHVVVIV